MVLLAVILVKVILIEVISRELLFVIVSLPLSAVRADRVPPPSKAVVIVGRLEMGSANVHRRRTKAGNQAQGAESTRGRRQTGCVQIQARAGRR